MVFARSLNPETEDTIIAEEVRKLPSGKGKEIGICALLRGVAWGWGAGHKEAVCK